jgi:alkanesulfonate monooxygenase SsuD/methylene tetrahydromethanopterin reductase-like flavin-dependent oxidoreductase (luciferase family)
MNSNPVDFGWLLPTGKQRMPARDIHYTSHIHRIIEQIRGAFHSIWIPDHFMEGHLDLPEALVSLSYLAGRYPGLHLGTAVLGQSYRNPALLAKMGATLQQLSGGRFILGIGAGGRKTNTWLTIISSLGHRFGSPNLRRRCKS